MTKQESIEEIINKVTNRKSKGKLFNRVPMTKQEEGWEKNFDEKFYVEDEVDDWGSTPSPKDIKSFINTLLERVIDEINSNEKRFRLDNNQGKFAFKQYLKDKYVK